MVNFVPTQIVGVNIDQTILDNKIDNVTIGLSLLFLLIGIILIFKGQKIIGISLIILITATHFLMGLLF